MEGGPALIRIVFLLIIISLTSGCPIIIPLPAEHRDEVEKVQKQTVVGKTTREEVISILGKPDVSRDRYILYKHKEYAGGAGVGFILPPIGGGRDVGQRFMDLYFEFDNYGVLTDFRVDKYDKSLRSVKDDEDTQKDCDPGMESCI